MDSSSKHYENTALEDYDPHSDIMYSFSKHRDMSLPNYVSSLRISPKEIEFATEGFAEKKLLEQTSSFAKVYRGKLSQSGELIDIVARKSQQSYLLVNELRMSYILMHENIVSLLKFSVTGKGEAIMTTEYQANRSLSAHLSDSTLTWMQRLQICVGVAEALKYLHYDALDNYHVIHGNIKSSKILLNDKWEPKLYGFGYATKAKKHELYFSSHEYRGTVQYMDPAYRKTRGLSHKWDVFSFGVVLCEVLFGREAYIQNDDNWYFARLARSSYEERKLDLLIDPDLRKQMNLQSLEIFAETTYHCLQEEQPQRLEMNQVLSKLTKALNLQHKHENPDAASSSYDLKGKNFDHLKFRLNDIKLATNTFSTAYRIGSGGYGVVYRAKLEHLDEINPLAIEEKTKDKFSNKASMVAIKRLFSRNDEEATSEQSFFSEIKMLSNCKHENLVSLRGFCDEDKEMILVYDYISNGSLADYWEDNFTANLTWAQRIQICLDIAHGLKYLHSSTENKDTIIHRDIKSANILLDDKFVAKIADFGLCKLFPSNQQSSTLITQNICGTDLYMDPEYVSSGHLKVESDIYSFGVVLFEIMCGKLANDGIYNPYGLPAIARQCFEEGTLKNLIDPKIVEGDENIFMVIGGVDQESFDIFTFLAYKCLEETHLERPTIELAIDQLEKALNSQINNKKNLCMSLEAIKLGTQNFNDCNCIGEERFWKLYKGEVENANIRSAVIVKRWDREFDGGYSQLLREINIVSRNKYKNKNVIGFVGYCIENDENILVFEHASNGRLDKHLGDPSLTWMKRLKICIDVANGLEFLHRGGEDRENCVIHGDIKSGSILLDEDLNARISNFECSYNNTVYQEDIVDEEGRASLIYVDPDSQIGNASTTFKDLYSFGVTLIEMLSGRLVSAEGCDQNDSQSLGLVAVRHYDKHGNLDEMILKGIEKQISSESLSTFVDIALKCLKHSESTLAGDVARHLNMALDFQKVVEDEELYVSLKDIKLGTRNFRKNNCIREERFWKLYEGEGYPNEYTRFYAKRWHMKSRQANTRELQTELHMLLHYKHKSIITLIGYCIEMDENIILYYHGDSLDKYLRDPSLTWKKRLNICLSVAEGLEFLHRKINNDWIIHRGIKSSSIILYANGIAKISNFEMSCKASIHKRADQHLDANDCNSDLYSIGLVLIQILSGRLASGKDSEDHSQSLGRLAIELCDGKKRLNEMIFEGIKEQIAPNSLDSFESAILMCLKNDTSSPALNTSDLVAFLKSALTDQEDPNAWVPKLPIDYKEIIEASSTPEIYNSTDLLKEELYNMFREGIMLQDGKVMFSLGSNRGRNEMISARMFSYKNRKSQKWRSVQESRFHTASQMVDISKLKIKIKITTRLLSPRVDYGAYLIFKFCDSRKISNKPMYVDLKYQMGGQDLHAYFATWRDDNWMEIELYRFFSHKKDTDFEVVLESFSRYYCRNSPIYVEGIEFRVKDQQQIKTVSTSGPRFQGLLQNRMKRKKYVMLPAITVPDYSSNMKHLHLSLSSPGLRSQEAVELPKHHVFRIKYSLEAQNLSDDTEYLCYLVFKLSEKCYGLHCPVIVRDHIDRRSKTKKTKKAKIIYFRSPSPWNFHENINVPEQREDGFMEVNIWKFNSRLQCCRPSFSERFTRPAVIPMDLRLITYQGTMSGLIVCGVEFRPIE